LQWWPCETFSGVHAIGVLSHLGVQFTSKSLILLRDVNIFCNIWISSERISSKTFEFFLIHSNVSEESSEFFSSETFFSEVIGVHGRCRF
jgi:hypothetical protein